MLIVDRLGDSSFGAAADRRALVDARAVGPRRSGFALGFFRGLARMLRRLDLGAILERPDSEAVGVGVRGGGGKC